MEYSADDIRPLPDIATALTVVLEVSVNRDVSATARQVASGLEWSESLVDVAQSRLRYVGAPRLTLSEALNVFNSTCAALQGRASTDAWLDTLQAALGDGPHAVVTVAADIAAESTELSRADAAQVSRMRVFAAEPIIVRAVSWPHTPERVAERSSAQALLDAAGAALAPDYELDSRPSFAKLERRVQVLLSQLRSRAPDHLIEQAIDLVDHGEYAIALEDLAENLYEHAIALRAQDLERFGRLAHELGLRDERWSFIRELARDDTSP